MNLMFDTIAAQATPSGRGGVGIVRISGANIPSIAKKLLNKPLPEPRYAEYIDFLDEDGSVIDQGIALFFKKPHSFTGEDVLELQGHGGAVVLDRLLTRTLKLGARMARPGEFSERAFLNGKIDLVQAEAISDLIDASSTVAARSAVRSLQGEFSRKIHQMVDGLILLRTYIEASIDFPDEEGVEFLAHDRLIADLKNLQRQLVEVQILAKQGELLKNGVNVVLAGPPNSGKSSLLNQLGQQDLAIVTDIPGTTRDSLKHQVQIDGVLLDLIDTAGIREETQDPIEREGIIRAKKAIETADRVFFVIDVTKKNEMNVETIATQYPHKKITLIFNKIDLIEQTIFLDKERGFDAMYISAKTGKGISDLKTYIKKSVGLDNMPENQFIARRRHVDALARAGEFLNKAQDQGRVDVWELVAEELKQAQEALSEITGEFRSDDLLGKIFSEFCVGK